ncbi:signal peptidase I [Zhaonella formicivorans]|uniref:signal peptidase I n=1 Tax=Zhaonella formicivorans TaxID=2528593 RepID=UPI0010EA8185|nr:signal peptidase I [Zhaonella formicivorans]
MFEGKNRGSTFAELLESIAIAVILAFVIRIFLFQPFYIPSGSMEPTLMIGDRIIVNKITYRFSEPKRGDVIVFKYPLEPKRDYIKRVVGLPGETLEIKDGTLYINDRPTPEEYLPPNVPLADYGPITIPKNAYFMMGDNRSNSQDSRFWGTLQRDYIIGKAVLIFWPLNRFGTIK